MRSNTMGDGVCKEQRLRLPLKVQFAPLKRNGTPKGFPQNRVDVGVPHLQIAHDPGGGVSQTNVGASLRIGWTRA